jgi:type I restriction enzyme M protein
MGKVFWKSLNSEYLKEIKIPLPLKEIQEKIVNNILEIEKKESYLKNEVENLEKNIESLIKNAWGEETILWEIAEIKKWTSITKLNTNIWNIPVIAWWREPAYYNNIANRDWNIITVSASWANAGLLNYFEKPIFASDCNTIKSKNEKIITTRLIFISLKIIQNIIYWLQRWQAQPHVYWNELEKIKIKIPNNQQEIIKKIEEIEEKLNNLRLDLESLKSEKQKVLDENL